ncbi:hypothetical protein BN159_1214 [Streptomyces davaonensis JCM 4913]|uniref:Uncharacterized protein n=1 Tax=Streptomyces davaonensis (strain DSM 101723 / JCM 4913 / KCC S-0913 / 768) TaxID=1214101 RepID=K4QX17_STRDJ|nr:hypothetical protein BN159_1214 [Streptomyces davaonensis JCM 4913]
MLLGLDGGRPRWLRPAFGFLLAPAAVARYGTRLVGRAIQVRDDELIAGLWVARLYGYGPGPAADIATTLLARGEFAPFIAGYVLDE